MTSNTLSPQAARLVRLATLINDEQLPPASISIAADGSHVQVTASQCPLVENTVRRWAAALEMVVTETPSEVEGRIAATTWSASGWDGTGTWWLIAGTEIVPAPAAVAS
jgi:hypothetical protein